MKPNQIDYDNLTFSFTETKSMYVSKCRLNQSWKEGKLVPFNDVKISPAATILNYGQGLFEGMKAYRTKNDEIIMFRPDENPELIGSDNRLYDLEKKVCEIASVDRLKIERSAPSLRTQPGTPLASPSFEHRSCIDSMIFIRCGNPCNKTSRTKPAEACVLLM